ncbi:MAG: hypothetical protein ACRCYO_01105 [Bacteroidia bacterium]
MKKILFTLFFATCSFALVAQDFEVPQNYKFDKAEDYAPYEQDIIKCVDWLINTPINEQKAKRKEANAFLLKWINGSPDVSIVIDPKIVTFSGGDMLLIFMGGWTKYAIETRNFKDKVGGNVAGIEAVIAFYTKNKEALGKNKDVEKYIKMQTQGKLKEYIEKKV